MKRRALWNMHHIWLWKYILAEMLGSLSSRLGLARLPSTFQAAAATLLPASLFSTSSFAMADSGGRWWSDRIANKKRRRWGFTKLSSTFSDKHCCRLGYHDKVKQEGPLPRVRDDSARIKQVDYTLPCQDFSSNQISHKVYHQIFEEISKEPW